MESRVKSPAKPVHVVVQQIGESDEKVVSRIRTENYDHEALLIMVNFVEPLKL